MFHLEGFNPALPVENFVAEVSTRRIRLKIDLIDADIKKKKKSWNFQFPVSFRMSRTRTTDPADTPEEHQPGSNQSGNQISFGLDHSGLESCMRLGFWFLSGDTSFGASTSERDRIGAVLGAPPPGGIWVAPPTQGAPKNNLI